MGARADCCSRANCCSLQFGQLGYQSDIPWVTLHGLVRRKKPWCAQRCAGLQAFPAPNQQPAHTRPVAAIRTHRVAFSKLGYQSDIPWVTLHRLVLRRKKPWCAQRCAGFPSAESTTGPHKTRSSHSHAQGSFFFSKNRGVYEVRTGGRGALGFGMFCTIRFSYKLTALPDSLHTSHLRAPHNATGQAQLPA